MFNGVYDSDDVSIDEFKLPEAGCYWIDKQGERHKITEMSVAHIVNCIVYLVKHNCEGREVAIRKFTDELARRAK